MENRAVCCQSKKELSYCKSTTNVRDHSTQTHPLKYFQRIENKAEVKTKIDSYVKFVPIEGHAKKIAQQIVEMTVLDLRPVAVVEGTGFRFLINYIEIGY